MDQLILESFKVDLSAERDAHQMLAFPGIAIQHAVRIVDNVSELSSSPAAMLDEWATDNGGTRRTGGPSSISLRSFLIVTLMHSLADEPTSLFHMARALAERLNSAQLVSVGLSPEPRDVSVWYRRLKSAHQNLMGLVEAGTAESIGADPTQVQRRIDDLMSQIVANSALLGGFLARDSSGDASLDSIFIPTARRSSTAVGGSRSSRALEAGWYHQSTDGGPVIGRGAAHSRSMRFGYEADLLSTTLGRETDASSVVVGLSLHRPGMIANAASTLLPRYEALGLPTGNLRVSKAYGSLRVEKFHRIVQAHNWKLVREYRRDELGLQDGYTSGFTRTAHGVRRDARTEVNHYVLVEGTWYLHFMPARLIDAVRLNQLDQDHPARIDNDQLAELLERRRKYQLRAIGATNDDGSQRYRLPDPEGYLAGDSITGEIIDKPRAKTVTIPGSVGIRWRQPFPYLSPEWYEALGVHDSGIRFTETDGVRHSGYTAAALALAVAAAAMNVRTIDRYMRAVGASDEGADQ
ncbi:MAG: hypothetical protein HIU88_14120 [Acidobacteria bacterium]|nr:hypothetical protein [Acidobacteriota bacterium]